MKRHLLLPWLLLPVLGQSPTPAPLKLSRSKVTFVSDAPLERIAATTKAVKGALDPAQRTFAIRIPVRTFEGFNSPLQKEHFNENYMESDRWPDAVFTGRLIESIDMALPGRHAVRAKGILEIHGERMERIIPCELVVGDEGVRVSGRFDVELAAHGISIPGMVRQKIAPVIQVELDLLFTNR
ncbi:MAG: YceI family protein [Flavobacteriales bacterium]|nr:YceI family protein [Flavobacteriales bacterium]